MMPADVATQATDLEARYGHLSGAALLRPMIETEFAGKIAAVSSFGAEAAVLLDLVASIDAATPIIFLDTGKHFPETLAHRDSLIDHFGLTNVRSIALDPSDLDDHDPDGALWRRDPDRCCHQRKVVPLDRALEGFDAWITGRKQYQNDSRQNLVAIETEGARIKINPLASWTHADAYEWMVMKGLPEHPLVAHGYPSIGCAPCTEKAGDPNDVRSGRWTGRDKTECGINRPADPDRA